MTESWNETQRRRDPISLPRWRSGGQDGPVAARTLGGAFRQLDLAQRAAHELSFQLTAKSYSPAIIDGGRKTRNRRSAPVGLSVSGCVNAFLGALCLYRHAGAVLVPVADGRLGRAAGIHQRDARDHEVGNDGFHLASNSTVPFRVRLLCRNLFGQKMKTAGAAHFLRVSLRTI